MGGGGEPCIHRQSFNESRTPEGGLVKSMESSCLLTCAGEGMWHQVKSPTWSVGSAGPEPTHEELFLGLGQNKCKQKVGSSNQANCFLYRSVP